MRPLPDILENVIQEPLGAVLAHTVITDEYTGRRHMDIVQPASPAAAVTLVVPAMNDLFATCYFYQNAYP